MGWKLAASKKKFRTLSTDRVTKVESEVSEKLREMLRRDVVKTKGINIK